MVFSELVIWDFKSKKIKNTEGDESLRLRARSRSWKKLKGNKKSESSQKEEEKKVIPKIIVDPRADPKLSYAEGVGLSENGENGTFTVYAMKSSGLVTERECKVRMMSPIGPVKNMTIQNNSDGTFTGSYPFPFKVTGKYTIDILVDDRPIRNSPIIFTVLSVEDLTASYANGDGLIGKSGTFTIHMLTKQKQVFTGSCSCKVRLIGSRRDRPVHFRKLDDGKITVEYQYPLPADDYTIVVFLNNRQVQGYPKNFTVQKTAISFDAMTSYAQGDGLHGKSGQFNVYATSVNRQPFLGECPCTIDMSGPNGDIAVHTHKEGNGNTLIEYEYPLDAGSYSIKVFLDEQPIKDSPFTFIIDSVSPPVSYAEGSGITGESGQFIVYALTNKGEDFKGRYCFCEVQMKGPKGEVPVHIRKNNNGIGTYTVEYEYPIPSGKYQIEVLLDKQPIRGSPFSFTG